MQESDVNTAPDPPSRFKITGAKHGFKTHVFMCPLLSFHQLFQHCPTEDLEPSLFLKEMRWGKQTTEKNKNERKKESVRAKVGRKGRIIKKKKTRLFCDKDLDNFLLYRIRSWNSKDVEQFCHQYVIN